MLIEDPEDPRVEPFRNIKERDLVGRQGRLIAEGEVVLRVLLRSALFRPLSILVDEKRLACLQPLLAQAPEGVPVYAAGQAVLDGIAGFHLHRGILALAERVAAPNAEQLLAGLPERALVVALHGIGNHDNMGGVFRNAAAFGASAVLLDPTCCDPLYRKAIRVSVGGTLTVPFARTEDPADLLMRSGFEVIALSPSGREVLNTVQRPARVAALFGAEGPGLPAAVLERARTVRIPMSGGFDSLNVATTCGIVLATLADGPKCP